MIIEIGVRDLLPRSQHACDLLTRPTGREIRRSIETRLAAQATDVVILDFSRIRIIDFSCADEVLAQVVQLAPCVVVVRGLTEHHVDAVIQVLERQHLAVVVEQDGALDLLGEVASRPRAAFEAPKGRGVAAAEELAPELALPADDVAAALDELAGRRLILRGAGRYHVPTAVA